MAHLILVRHGQSTWNLKNVFTGWVDVGLSEQGIREAKEAGIRLNGKDMTIDVCFTSYLKRAIHTAYYMLDALNLNWLDVYKAWQLNERHYGALQGLNKEETIQEYGLEQVHLWRRSFDVRPPKMSAAEYEDFLSTLKYRDKNVNIPYTESLKDTIRRVLPYYEKEILPYLQQGKTVMVVAHGNSLRALIKHLEMIDDDAITQLEIQTGKPIVYRFDERLAIIEKYDV